MPYDRTIRRDESIRKDGQNSPLGVRAAGSVSRAVLVANLIEEWR